MLLCRTEPLSCEITYSHPVRILKQKNCTLNASIIGVIEVPKQLPVMLTSIRLKQLACKCQLWTTFIDQAEEISEAESFVQIQKNQINCAL